MALVSGLIIQRNDKPSKILDSIEPKITEESVSSRSSSFFDFSSIFLALASSLVDPAVNCVPSRDSEAFLDHSGDAFRVDNWRIASLPPSLSRGVIVA